MRREHNDLAWLAWHVEALSRQKKLPKLKALMLGGKEKPKRKQTWQEQLDIAKAWTAAQKRT